MNLMPPKILWPWLRGSYCHMLMCVRMCENVCVCVCHIIVKLILHSCQPEAGQAKLKCNMEWCTLVLFWHAINIYGLFLFSLFFFGQPWKYSLKEIKVRTVIQ